MAGGTLKGFDLQRPAAMSVRPPDYVLARSLLANTAEAFTIPSGARYAQFGWTVATDLYVNYTAAATVPGDVTDGTASMHAPTGVVFVSGVTSISVISPSACVATLGIWTD